jgi:hypothetical protein
VSRLHRHMCGRMARVPRVRALAYSERTVRNEHALGTRLAETSGHALYFLAAGGHSGSGPQRKSSPRGPRARRPLVWSRHLTRRSKIPCEMSLNEGSDAVRAGEPADHLMMSLAQLRERDTPHLLIPPWLAA